MGDPNKLAWQGCCTPFLERTDDMVLVFFGIAPCWDVRDPHFNFERCCYTQQEPIADAGKLVGTSSDELGRQRPHPEEFGSWLGLSCNQTVHRLPSGHEIVWPTCQRSVIGEGRTASFEDFFM